MFRITYIINIPKCNICNKFPLQALAAGCHLDKADFTIYWSFATNSSIWGEELTMINRKLVCNDLFELYIFSIESCLQN